MILFDIPHILCKLAVTFVKNWLRIVFSNIEDEQWVKMARIQVRCRRCRTFLLSEDSAVDSHGEPLQELSKRSCGGMHNSGKSHLFISLDHGPPWILDAVEEKCYQQGKLLCPKCQGRLGSFDLVRIRPCYCGETTLPTIHLLCDRIDLCDLNVRLETMSRVAGMCGSTRVSRVRDDRSIDSNSHCEVTLGSTAQSPRQAANMGGVSLTFQAGSSKEECKAKSNSPMIGASDLIARDGTSHSEPRQSTSDLTNSFKPQAGFNLKSLLLNVSRSRAKRPAKKGPPKHEPSCSNSQQNSKSRRRLMNGDLFDGCSESGLYTARCEGDRTSMSTSLGHTYLQADAACGSGFSDLDWDDDEGEDGREQWEADGIPLEKRRYGLSSLEREMLRRAREAEEEKWLEAEPVGWDFTCPLCLEVMLRPHTTWPCRHNFCEGCLRHLNSAYSQRAHTCCCPMCRKPIASCSQNSVLEKLLVEQCPLHIKKRLEDEKRSHSRHRNFPLPGAKSSASYLVSLLLQVRITQWAIIIVTALIVMSLSYVGMGICRHVLSVSAEVFDSVTERLTGERLWSEFMGLESRMLTVSCWFVLYLVCSWTVRYLRIFRPVT